MNLHAAIRQLRETLKLSQQVFATQLGISIRSYASYEKSALPGLALLNKLHKLSLADPRISHEIREALRAGLRDAVSREMGEELPAQLNVGPEGGHMFQIIESGEEHGYAVAFTLAMYLLRNPNPNCQSYARAALTSLRDAMYVGGDNPGDALAGLLHKAMVEGAKKTK